MTRSVYLPNHPRPSKDFLHRMVRPLHNAASHAQLGALRRLLRRRADAAMLGRGESAVHAAVCEALFPSDDRWSIEKRAQNHLEAPRKGTFDDMIGKRRFPALDFFTAGSADKMLDRKERRKVVAVVVVVVVVVVQHGLTGSPP